MVEEKTVDDDDDDASNDNPDEAGIGETLAKTKTNRSFLGIIAVIVIFFVIISLVFSVLFFSTNIFNKKAKTNTAKTAVTDKKNVIQKKEVKTEENIEKPKPKPETEVKKKSKKIKYVKLFEALDALSAANILRELSMEGINFDTEQVGKNVNIEVDEVSVEKAKRLLALKGLPGGAVKGFDLFDQPQGMGVTEFDKRIKFMRALSGELENSIIQFDAIEGCKVQIVMPEQKLFSTVQPPVTASILVRKRRGKFITDDVVLAIIELVSNAVENLKPENISVIDTEGYVLSNGLMERINKKKKKLEALDSKSQKDLIYAEFEAELIEKNEKEIPKAIVVAEEKIKKVEEVKQPEKIVPAKTKVMPEETVVQVKEVPTEFPETPETKPTAKVEKIEEKKAKVVVTANISTRQELKENYEKFLRQRATSGLVEILPKNTFEIEIETDVEKISESGFPEIKKIIATIVVDKNLPTLKLTAKLKEKIYANVAGSIGYIKGRDAIKLEVASIINKQITTNILPAIIKAKEIRHTKLIERPVFVYTLERIIKKNNIYVNLSIAGGFVLILLGVIFGIIKIWPAKKIIKKEPPQIKEDFFQAQKAEVLTNARLLEEIKGIANLQPLIIAKIMEEWLKKEEVKII